MNQENVAFSDIVAELKAICNEGRSGTMFITSQANRSAQIVIDKGTIVFLYYFNKRGQDALHLMPEIVSGKYRFQEGSVPGMRSQQPSSEETIRFLAAAAGETGVLEEGPDPVPAAAAAGEPLPAGSVALTSQQRQTLEEGLAIHIGPMASIICEDHLANGIDARSAVDLLAAEIPTKEAARSFREAMQQRLSL